MLQHYASGAILVDTEPGVNSRSTNRAWAPSAGPALAGKGHKSLVLLTSQKTLFCCWCKAKLFVQWTQTYEPHLEVDVFLERLRTATLKTCLFPSEIPQAFKEWSKDLMSQEELPLTLLSAFPAFEKAFAFAWFQDGPDGCVFGRKPL